MAKFKNWEYDVTFLYEGELLLIPFQRRRSAACHEVMQLSSQRARHFMFPHPLAAETGSTSGDRMSRVIMRLSRSSCNAIIWLD